ncbi:hypothetical protein GCM10008171_25470 [Methylopila jiangsuensis]|uniref:Transporter n=1 Tax=Methylopila jiangsuensis TaxID=586230 RepID=A0A9W6N4G1_9HYPH|nr:transporter [Methylopila jiangsuensis]MDR6286370.1 hypothetical protein [Methylopila jiangsuensis]GLK77293.1 hypothetical protein GCM10008171_25470 [Methylopila jiangsuensis]
MTISMTMKGVAAGAAIGLAFAATPAGAAGTTAPGYTTGIPVWAVAPEGLYYLNQTYSGFREVGGVDIRSNYNTFFFFWQTGAKFLGADIGLIAAPTIADVSIEGAGSDFGLFNTYFAAQLSWDLGDDLYVGYRLGGYIPQDEKLSLDYGTIEHRVGASYLGDGWNLTGNFMFGTPVGDKKLDLAPNYVIADLTATKKFGKFEIGPVAHFEADVSKPISWYGKQSQFAIGGLIGYDFGGANLNVKLTRDVYSKNRGFKDTILWTNLSFPLWTPAKAEAPLVVKY